MIREEEAASGPRFVPIILQQTRAVRMLGRQTFIMYEVKAEAKVGRRYICGNTITAREGASNVGYHNFGNTTPDRTCCIL
ncbi:hypothetical protein GBA52_004150 [Prunus armeniaca]|nr:hypothetical protein GBA52_004150 [Prunus armeniaca]